MSRMQESENYIISISILLFVWGKNDQPCQTNHHNYVYKKPTSTACLASILGASLRHLARNRTSSAALIPLKGIHLPLGMIASFPGCPSQNQAPRRRFLLYRVTKITQAPLEETCFLAPHPATFPLRGNRSHAPTSIHLAAPLPFALCKVDLSAALTIFLFASSRLLSLFP